MANNSYSATISLTSLRDAREQRLLTLRPNQPINVGRSSKSAARARPVASDNAYFDCPVISREHAEIKLNAWAAANDQITIMDRASMHGTQVNGEKLKPHLPMALRDGDRIRFGTDVSRGIESHEGVVVIFKRVFRDLHDYSQADSRGYHVPSISEYDSEEEDESVSSINESSEHGDSSEQENEEEGEDDDVHKTSSAITTPEQVKAKPGSATSPIDVDRIAGNSQITVLEVEDDDDEEEEQDESYIPPAAEQITSPVSKQPLEPNVIIPDSLDQHPEVLIPESLTSLPLPFFTELQRDHFDARCRHVEINREYREMKAACTSGVLASLVANHQLEEPSTTKATKAHEAGTAAIQVDDLTPSLSQDFISPGSKLSSAPFSIDLDGVDENSSQAQMIPQAAVDRHEDVNPPAEVPHSYDWVEESPEEMMATVPEYLQPAASSAPVRETYHLPYPANSPMEIDFTSSYKPALPTAQRIGGMEPFGFHHQWDDIPDYSYEPIKPIPQSILGRQKIFVGIDSSGSGNPSSSDRIAIQRLIEDSNTSTTQEVGKKSEISLAGTKRKAEDISTDENATTNNNTNDINTVDMIPDAPTVASNDSANVDADQRPVRPIKKLKRRHQRSFGSMASYATAALMGSAGTIALLCTPLVDKLISSLE